MRPLSGPSTEGGLGDGRDEVPVDSGAGVLSSHWWPWSVLLPCRRLLGDGDRRPDSRVAG